MAANGKGISDAVRESIAHWITDDLVDKLLPEYQAQSVGAVSRQKFMLLLRRPAEWVRKVRRGLPNGWERDYVCKSFMKRDVGLRVHTDKADQRIKYVTFRIGNKLVGGGVVDVPSVHIGHATAAGARIKDTGGMITTNVAPRFRPFTAAEIAKLTTEIAFGDEAMDSMFEERD